MYKHLSLHEREQIETLLKNNLSIRGIALLLNRSPSTISREIKRNYWEAFRSVYNFSCAQRKADNRKFVAKKPIKMNDPELFNFVTSQLKMKLSPEQISGKAKVLNLGYSISYETIYLYIYKSIREFICYLPQRRKKRQKRSNEKLSRAIIPNRIGINERPSDINNRKEFGHWEADTVEGIKGKSALNVMVERKSGYVMISKISDKSAIETKKAICKNLESMPKSVFQSITYDNGTENVLHGEINDKYHIQSYFCNPYSSWEKGSVENLNGLIRRYFPKKTNFDIISEEEIKSVEFELNNKPRKRFDFLTPNEVLCKTVALGF